MNKQQKIFALGAVGLIVLFFLVISGVFTSPDTDTGARNETVTRETPVSQPLPTSVDGITEEIMSEAAMDEKALTEEQEGEQASITEDSNSVNDLGNSYDEKSY